MTTSIKRKAYEEFRTVLKLLFYSTKTLYNLNRTVRIVFQGLCRDDFGLKGENFGNPTSLF